jgi:hypothetical protein
MWVRFHEAGYRFVRTLTNARIPSNLSVQGLDALQLFPLLVVLDVDIDVAVF